MKSILLLGLFVLATLFPCQARNKVKVEVTIQPDTHSFSCRYTLDAASATPGSLVLYVNKTFQVAQVIGPQVLSYRSSRFFDIFQQDTLQQLAIQFATAKPRQRLTVAYSGTLPSRFYADSVVDFTAQAGWLPNILHKEYELVDYQLVVLVPEVYHVVSTQLPRRSAPGRYTFTGTAPNIEIGGIAARRFTTLSSEGKGPQVSLVKANRPMNALDRKLLENAENIIRHQNQTFGSKAPITRFTLLLPSLNRSASGLLDNAAVIAYLNFNTEQDPEDLMILAHEISHKWWGYGAWDTYNNWLNEAFASYSGLLYLQAVGDTASFRKQLVKRQKSAALAPGPILGFELTKYDYQTRRSVIYDKGTIILYELHQRLGDQPFFQILTKTAAAKAATTEEFLQIVEQQSGPETRSWLENKLRT
ncbi:M1 family aminopeptidase [Hymenobacter seoulensis]